MTGSGTLLVFDDRAKPLTRKQWEKWEQVGLDAELGLDRLVLNWTGRKIADLGTKGALTAVAIETTIEGAPTITVTLKDPDRRLFSKRAGRTDDKLVPKSKRGDPVAVDEGWDPILPPDIVGKPMEVQLDGVVYRLVKVRYSTANEEAELTFEHRLVYALRRKRGAKHANRKRCTRAQFLLALAKEVRAVPFRYVCPELNKRQAVDQGKNTGAPAGAASARQSGQSGLNRIFPAHGLGQPGRRLTPEEVRACAAAGGFWGRELTGMEQLAHGESDYHPGIISSDGGIGLWQNTPRVWGAVALAYMRKLGGEAALRNPVISAKMARFLYEDAGGYGPWYGTRYLTVPSGPGNAGPSRSEARALAERVIGGEDPDGAGASGRYVTKTRSYQFERRRGEHSWSAMQRLSSEVRWRCFVVGNSLYYMSEDQLYARRPRYVVCPPDYTPSDRRLERAGDAVLDLNYDVDWGKPVSEATLTVTLDRWGAPPGSIILLEGFGPPNGRWLVTGVRRDYFSPIAEVTLRQPARAALEPANERVQKAVSQGAPGSSSGARGPEEARRFYERALAISKQNLPYVWGGGHGTAGQPSGGGYDCSGYISACCLAAGWGGGVLPAVSGNFGSLPGAKPGAGRFVTVHYNSGHVWASFGAALGVPHARADTSAYGSGGSGPHVRTGERPTSGFASCHFGGD